MLKIFITVIVTLAAVVGIVALIKVRITERLTGSVVFEGRLGPQIVAFLTPGKASVLSDVVNALLSVKVSIL